jgi:hypothetical protein
MLSYLSKFVLQMLPTISATVIGAYIVATWINPKTPPETAKIAAGAPRQQPAKVASPVAEPAQDALAQAESRAADAPAAKTAPETVRIIPIVRQPAPSQEAASSTPAPLPPVAETATATEERKDASALARAAIQRQRSVPETSHAADEPAKPAAAGARSQQARNAPDVQPAVATIAPPLPPAVTIAPLRPPQTEVADERPSPPGEIPSARHPLSLQASHRVAENPSPADEFLNATRSFFRALTPQ